jgi:hypothetical protein
MPGVTWGPETPGERRYKEQIAARRARKNKAKQRRKAAGCASVIMRPAAIGVVTMLALRRRKGRHAR